MSSGGALRYASGANVDLCGLCTFSGSKKWGRLSVMASTLLQGPTRVPVHNREHLEWKRLRSSAQELHTPPLRAPPRSPQPIPGSSCPSDNHTPTSRSHHCEIKLRVVDDVEHCCAGNWGLHPRYDMTSRTTPIIILPLPATGGAMQHFRFYFLDSVYFAQRRAMRRFMHTGKFQRVGWWALYDHDAAACFCLCRDRLYNERHLATYFEFFFFFFFSFQTILFQISHFIRYFFGTFSSLYHLPRKAPFTDHRQKRFCQHGEKIGDRKRERRRWDMRES